MKALFDKVRELVARNAQHRKGFRLGDMTPADMLRHADEELAELAAAPDDPAELADLLGVLAHYAVRHGWPIEELERLAIEKLAQRFSADRCPRCGGDNVLVGAHVLACHGCGWHHLHAFPCSVCGKPSESAAKLGARPAVYGCPEHPVTGQLGIDADELRREWDQMKRSPGVALPIEFAGAIHTPVLYGETVTSDGLLNARAAVANPCTISYAHQPHDYCDGKPTAPRVGFGSRVRTDQSEAEKNGM